MKRENAYSEYSSYVIAFFAEYLYALYMDKEAAAQRVGNLISQERIVSFSDAVFAFAATLLVLKIDLPDTAKAQLATNFSTIFFSLWPQYYANIISFVLIGYYWLNHHAIFGMVKKFDMTIVWLNLFFLLLVSFIPFPVDLFGDFPTVPGVMVFYSASLAIVGYVLAFLWWYASSQHRLISVHFGEKQIQYYTIRNLVAPVIFTISIPLVAIDPLIAQASWVFVIVGLLLVNHLFRIKAVGTIEQITL